MGRLLSLTVLALFVLMPAASSAADLDLTQRKVTVSGKLNVAAATKVADSLISIDAQAQAPIFMIVTATDGTAQGVMLLADTIRSLNSPVVSVVATQVHGAGAAVATFADKVVVYRSAGLAFTDVPYEGVKKYEEPKPPSAAPAKKDGDDAKEPPKAKESPKDKDKPKPKAKAKAKERTATEKFLQDVVRTKYLERFHQALAKRIHWKAKRLAKQLSDEGGIILTPKEAVEQKIADEVIDRISYEKLPEIKREVKVTTTDKVTTTEQRSE
jgi:ATP-dependent protease ClpP protease subunit